MGQIKNSPTTSEKNENGYHAIFFQAKWSEKVEFHAIKKKLAKKSKIAPFMVFKGTCLKTVFVRDGKLQFLPPVKSCWKWELQSLLLEIKLPWEYFFSGNNGFV